MLRPAQPRLVLRDAQGNYCIGGMADPSNAPKTVVHGPHTFTLTRTTPRMVLYVEQPHA